MNKDRLDRLDGQSRGQVLHGNIQQNLEANKAVKSWSNGSNYYCEY